MQGQHERSAALLEGFFAAKSELIYIYIYTYIYINILPFLMQGQHERSAVLLENFFTTKSELEAAGRDYKLPSMGLPLVRFYAAHAAYAVCPRLGLKVLCSY